MSVEQSRKYKSPNNQSYKFSNQEEWVKVVAEIIRLVLYREPTLKDYTCVTRKYNAATTTYFMYVHDKYIGYAYSKNQKVIFIPND